MINTLIKYKMIDKIKTRYQISYRFIFMLTQMSHHRKSDYFRRNFRTHFDIGLGCLNKWISCPSMAFSQLSLYPKKMRRMNNPEIFDNSPLLNLVGVLNSLYRTEIDDICRRKDSRFGSLQ